MKKPNPPQALGVQPQRQHRVSIAHDRIQDALTIQSKSREY